MTKTIAITGATGLVGTKVQEILRDHGAKVVILTRDPNNKEGRHWNPTAPDPEILAGTHAVIHLAGSPIAGRFTKKHKNLLQSSRIRPTEYLARRASETPGVQAFISASAVGYYGTETPGAVDESASSGKGFLAAVCRSWEAAALEGSNSNAATEKLRVVRIRSGLALDPDALLLKSFIRLTQFGVNGPLAGGKQYFPWIALEDLARIYATAALNDEWQGAYNAVAPGAITQKQFTKALGSALNRPTFMPVPGFAPTLLLGREGARELALADQHVTPKRTLEEGFEYRFPTIEDYFATKLS